MMSDEESFVILGSSPMSSLESDGIADFYYSNHPSSESDSPGSRFASLKNSAIGELRNAQEVSLKSEAAGTQLISTKSQEIVNQMTDSVKTYINTVKSDNEENAASNVWSCPPQVDVQKILTPLNLEDCALKSPLEEKQQQTTEELLQKKLSNAMNLEQSSKKTLVLPTEGNLAASFIMGEVDSNVLKTSVYSQFPSISMEACAEDVVKLQNMVTEYSQLKATIKKANNTMKLFYHNSLQWKDKMNTIEEQYKQQLDQCQKEIEELRKQNKEMKINFNRQIEALEVVRKNDREENVRAISEKNALLENLRAQIVKLEQRQLSSFQFVEPKKEQLRNDEFENVNAKNLEHELQIKELQRELSKILASNLSLKDVEKQYIDELNYLKVNLTAATELIGKNRAEIAQLTALNTQKETQIETIENSLKSLQLQVEQQKERILLLETQNEVYRSDFQMEKQSREVAVKEKHQILQDLRLLQKRNQELIEEHQKLADGLQKKIAAANGNNESEITATSVAGETYSNNLQRPIRASPSKSNFFTTSPAALHMCPVCNKGFKSLSILLSHVNDCVDKN